MAFLVSTRVYALCGLLLIWGPATIVSASGRVRAEPSLFSAIQGAETDSVTSVRSFDSLINLKRRPQEGAALPPQTSSDGLCYSYVLQGGDTCASIAREFGITENVIESFNMQTFAWNGCNKLKQGNFICLSSGEPPMPVAFQGAVCGPQVPGTPRPKNMADLESLNPCPADQCCDLSMATCKDSCTPKMTPSNDGEITHLVADAVTSTLAAATGVKIATKTREEPREMSTTSTATRPTSTWRSVIYSEMDCEGDYYYVEGLDQTYEDCVDLHGGLSTDWDQKVSCRWYTDGGESWTNCDKSPLKNPAAWSFENAFCTVYSTRNCTNPDNDSQIFTSAGRKGCTSGYNAPLSVAEWNSMHCNIISIHDNS